jgi:hypothetical protein
MSASRSSGGLVGQTAFVADKEKGLLALDFSNPVNPRQVGRYFPMAEARRVTMSGTTAYVAAGLSGMRTIDLSDPAHPRETSWTDTAGGYATKAIASGSKVYLSVSGGTDDPLQVFDASNPLKPAQISALKAFTYGRRDGAFRSMALSDNGLMYVAAEQYDLVVDVSSPQSPQADSWLALVNPINAAASGSLFVSVSNTQMQFVDASEPKVLKQVGLLDRSTSGEAVTFVNPTLLATAGGGDGLWLVDASNPAKPFKRGSLGGLGPVMDISIDGSTAYASSLGGGVRIVDISNPAAPKLAGTVSTPGLAYDSFVSGNLMLVADSYDGLLIYQRGQSGPGGGLAAVASGGPSVAAPEAPPAQTPPTPGTPNDCLVSNNADDGDGSLRACLANIQDNTTVTFDPGVFRPAKPVAIHLASPLPNLDRSYITIDASSAGVILDGSGLSSGSGLSIYGSDEVIMGLEILHFPENGIYLEGGASRIGGDRSVGAAPTGQGNLLSGNGIYGLFASCKKCVVSGNLVGTDLTGTKAMPNQVGIFVVEGGVDVTVGGLTSGQSNLLSGNLEANINSWGLRTRIIGNRIGLDLAGKRALKPDTASDIRIESGAIDNLIGGTEPGARNIISGAMAGVIFSDANTYQNSLIGNYIGTDISGTKAVPNFTGVLIWTASLVRVGGTAAGEGNLISANKTAGLQLNGYGATDNLVLGNSFGLDSAGKASLPNGIGISIDSGQRHDTIGGPTAAEANTIVGGAPAIQISDPGVKFHYVAGNVISGAAVAGIYVKSQASDNFIVANSISSRSAPGVLLDGGPGNQLRANKYDVGPASAIKLGPNGSGPTPAVITSATSSTVTGTSCAGCIVEVYSLSGNKAEFTGRTQADGSGKFEFAVCEPLAGDRVAALVLDKAGSTSSFSAPAAVAAGGGANPACAAPDLASLPTLGPIAAGSAASPTPVATPTPGSSVSPESVSGSGGSATPIILGGLIVLLVIGLAVGLVWARRSRRAVRISGSKSRGPD